MGEYITAGGPQFYRNDDESTPPFKMANAFFQDVADIGAAAKAKNWPRAGKVRSRHLETRRVETSCELLSATTSPRMLAHPVCSTGNPSAFASLCIFFVVQPCYEMRTCTTVLVARMCVHE